MDKTDLMAQIEAICSYLPGGPWSVDGDTPDHVIAMAECGALVGFSEQGAVVYVHPCPPKRHGRYAALPDWGVIGCGERPPECTFRADRYPHTVAAQVARKVVDPYLAMYPEIEKRMREDEEHTRRTTENAARLAELLHADQTTDEDGCTATVRLYNLGEVSYGTIRVTGDNVRVDLSVTAAGALALAQTLANMR